MLYIYIYIIYIYTCIHDCAPLDFFGLKRLHVLC